MDCRVKRGNDKGIKRIRRCAGVTAGADQSRHQGGGAPAQLELRSREALSLIRAAAKAIAARENVDPEAVRKALGKKAGGTANSPDR